MEREGEGLDIDLPFRVAVVSESHISHAKVVKQSQSSQRTVDRMSSFNANKTTDVSCIKCFLYACDIEARSL